MLGFFWKRKFCALLLLVKDQLHTQRQWQIKENHLLEIKVPTAMKRRKRKILLLLPRLSKERRRKVRQMSLKFLPVIKFYVYNTTNNNNTNNLHIIFSNSYFKMQASIVETWTYQGFLINGTRIYSKPGGFPTQCRSRWGTSYLKIVYLLKTSSCWNDFIYFL